MIDAQRLRDLAVYYFILEQPSQAQIELIKYFVRFVIDYQKQSTPLFDSEMHRVIAEYVSDEMNKVS